MIITYYLYRLLSVPGQKHVHRHIISDVGLRINFNNMRFWATSIDLINTPRKYHNLANSHVKFLYFITIHSIISVYKCRPKMRVCMFC